MQIFRVILVVVWLAIVYVTVQATLSAGMAVSGDVFADDLAALGWRAQFNVDLLSHMLLAGLWVAWRSRFSIGGIATSLLCLFGGGLFTVIYVFGLSLYHKGDVVRMVLGRQYPETAAAA